MRRVRTLAAGGYTVTSTYSTVNENYTAGANGTLSFTVTAQAMTFGTGSVTPSSVGLWCGDGGDPEPGGEVDGVGDGAGGGEFLIRAEWGELSGELRAGDEDIYLHVYGGGDDDRTACRGFVSGDV